MTAAKFRKIEPLQFQGSVGHAVCNYGAHDNLLAVYGTPVTIHEARAIHARIGAALPRKRKGKRK